jgi:hypothetical protein
VGIDALPDAWRAGEHCIALERKGFLDPVIGGLGARFRRELDQMNENLTKQA